MPGEAGNVALVKVRPSGGWLLTRVVLGEVVVPGKLWWLGRQDVSDEL